MSSPLPVVLLAFAAMACSSSDGPGVVSVADDASAGDAGREAAVKPQGSVDSGLNAPYYLEPSRCAAPLICLAGACFD